MAEEIRRIITVDTKNSDKSIRDLKNEIKGLQKELEQTAVGSDEFNSALKKLTQTQKSYNEIQQQVRQMSRTGQQDMVRFASFAQNLGKAYSALNAAVGLFANGNEDVQKAMLKVQRTIQLIQGLEGITGLIRDLPKVANAFKGWLTSLSPIERSVNNIAKQIKGINPNKLNGPNGTGGGGAAAAAAAGGGGGGVRDIDIETQALAEQTRVVTALNKAQEEAVNREKSLRSEMEKTAEASESKIFGAKSMLTNADALVKQMEKTETQLNKLVAGYGSLDEAMKNPRIKMVADNLSNLNEKIAAVKKKADEGIISAKELNAKYAELSVEAEKASKSVKELEGATKSGASSMGSFWTSVGTTVFWTVLISTLVTLVYKVWDYITSIKTAAKEQRALNKAISEGTNQIASKQIVVLKELALGYQRVGDSAEAKAKFIKDYADKIKETGIAVTDVNTADAVFINNTDKYVSAIMARAKAQATENKAIELYQEYLDKRYDIEEKLAETGKKLMNGAEPNYSLPMGQGMNTAYENKLNREMFDAILSQRDKLDADMEERLRKMFDSIANLDKEYLGLLGGGGSSSVEIKDNKEIEDTIKQDLEALIQYIKEAEQVLTDSETNELQAVADKYAERIALAKQYGKDVKILEEARDKELADIQKRYADQALEDERQAFQNILDEFERQRRMIQSEFGILENNLREPVERTHTFGPFEFQTLGDVNKNYEEQINYEQRLYNITIGRLTNEISLLKRKLELEGLSAEERLATENEIANLENQIYEAGVKRDNADKESKKKKFQSILDAAQGAGDAISSLTGGLANYYKFQSENEKLSEKERAKALDKYKKFAIAQAIADTWSSAIASYNAMAEIPLIGPALGAIAAAGAVTLGMTNVMNIKKEVESSSSITSGSSVSAPSAMSTPPIEYTRNLIGDKELDEMNQPIRCYVLEQDISNAQNKVKVTEQNASF